MATVVTGDIRTFYITEGRGYPLVFIHGALMDHRLWKPQLDVFSKKHYVVAYDLRGHGQSGKESHAHLTIDLLSHDLLDVLNNLGIACVHLCGLGLGGMVAQEFASCYPARVEKLVLCDTVSSAGFYWFDKLVLRVFDAASTLQKSLSDAEQNPPSTQKLLELLYGKRRLGENDEARAYLSDCLHAFSPAEIARILGMEAGYQDEGLSRIFAPTLILAGQNSSKITLRKVNWMSRQIPDNRSQFVPVAAYVSSRENANMFNQLVLDFLNASF